MTSTSFTARAAVARLVVTAAVLVAVACKDSNVPFFTAPTSVPNSITGINSAVTGLFSGTRADQAGYIEHSAGFGRQAADFINTEPRLVTYNTGLVPMTTTWAGIWATEYNSILASHQILAAIPKVAPAYSPDSTAAIVGVVQTLEALNYMYIAEIHDSLGAAILGTAGGLPPAYCNKDIWAYIVALLDSANAQLNVAGGLQPPIVFPNGFSAVSKTSGPSTTLNSFASFNRALAGKAGLELAYAIARTSAGSSPTPSTPGSPDVTALTRADSAITASALYAPNSLPQNPTAGWITDNFSVFNDYTASSGDQVNPINAISTTFNVLKELPDGQDTLNDLRWKAKFAHNINAVQQQSYSHVASDFLYTMYPNPSSPIPIVRSEGLTLVEAQIRLGLLDFTGAATLINDVRVEVGGMPAASIANNYVSTRDALLKEQQISTALEGSGDRMIAIRMYKLETVLDTTWGAQDVHTTLDPIPFAELSGRGGVFTTTCP
jgi:hypothetical protein